MPSTMINMRFIQLQYMLVMHHDSRLSSRHFAPSLDLCDWLHLFSSKREPWRVLEAHFWHGSSIHLLQVQSSCFFQTCKDALSIKWQLAGCCESLLPCKRSCSARARCAHALVFTTDSFTHKSTHHSCSTKLLLLQSFKSSWLVASSAASIHSFASAWLQPVKQHSSRSKL